MIIGNNLIEPKPDKHANQSQLFVNWAAREDYLETDFSELFLRFSDKIDVERNHDDKNMILLCPY